MLIIAYSGHADAQTRPQRHNPIEWSFHGKAFTDQYLATEGLNQGNIVQSNFSFWPELEAKFNESWSSRAVLATTLFLRNISEPNDVAATAELREAYLTYQAPGIEIRGGQQILPWGRSDGINPTDYFTAKDYTYYVPDDELRRRGDLTLTLSFTPKKGDSPWNIQLVGQAKYPQAKMLIPDQNLPAGITFERTAPKSRYFHPEDMQGAIRVQYLGNDFDFSLSTFRGSSVFPIFQLDPTRNVVEAFHTQQTAIGGDASFNIGESTVFRLESALLLPDNGSDTDLYFGLVQPHHWDTVIGIERPLWTDFRLQAQFLMRYYLYYRSPGEYTDANPTTTAIRQGIGRANALILNYPQQVNPGLTVRMSYESEASEWFGEVFLIGYFASANDYLIRPQIGYKPADNWRIVAGADLYGGNPNRTLGALKDRSALFGELKYFF